ncbi:hypothetical protein [Streptomyces griseorubiginosus]|uniref:hypothetical protein n=1 Tax=Streptomyces griseorubiginosus TaxID=67304 RepID=UPI0036E1ACE8
MSAPTTVQWLRGACVRVGAGSGRLAAHYAARLLAFGRRRYEGIAAWVNRSSGAWWLAKLALLFFLAGRLRLILFAVAERVYARVESGAWGWLLWTVAVLWVIGAYRAGAEDWKPKQLAGSAPDADEDQEPAAESEPDEAQEPGEELPAGPPLPALPDLRRALLRIGTPHAHITALADDLSTTPERVREALAKWDVPVEPVRMKGRPSSSTGVKGGPAVHPALAPRAEDVAVVAAGGAANNSNNNAFETVPDGENPHRTHVLWKDTA